MSSSSILKSVWASLSPTLILTLRRELTPTNKLLVLFSFLIALQISPQAQNRFLLFSLYAAKFAYE
jgi:hypothetical protein